MAGVVRTVRSVPDEHFIHTDGWLASTWPNPKVGITAVHSDVGLTAPRGKCQTLFIHVANPAAVIAEMQRTLMPHPFVSPGTWNRRGPLCATWGIGVGGRS